MSISIIVSDRLTFDIKGETRGDDGKALSFSFRLTATRLKGDELSNVMQSADSERVSIIDKLCELVTDWKDVKGPDGIVEFSTETLRDLLTAYPGLPALVWTRYIAEVAVRAKN
jgi:hypothetical protein